MPQHRTLRLLEHFLQHVGVDSRRGYVRTEAIDREQRQRKEQPVPQIFDPEEVQECLPKTIHRSSSVLPITPVLSLEGLPTQTCRPPW